MSFSTTLARSISPSTQSYARRAEESANPQTAIGGFVSSQDRTTASKSKVSPARRCGGATPQAGLNQLGPGQLAVLYKMLSEVLTTLAASSPRITNVGSHSITNSASANRAAVQPGARLAPRAGYQEHATERTVSMTIIKTTMRLCTMTTAASHSRAG